MLQKTRFICISDSHGQIPFKLPRGDVLIHAGDLTKQGSRKDLERTIEWIRRAECEVAIIIAGNHDITLDKDFYNKNRSRTKTNEDPNECIQVIHNSTSSSSSSSSSSSNPYNLQPTPKIIYLCHEPAIIHLKNPQGPKTTFKIFGSPYSPICHNTFAAFGYVTDQDAFNLWSEIPPDTDVVVTHTPPYGHLDSRIIGYGNSGRGELEHDHHQGCKVLRETLGWDVRPSLAVCGHVHESRGYERIQWQQQLSGKNSTVEKGTGVSNINQWVKKKKKKKLLFFILPAQHSSSAAATESSLSIPTKPNSKPKPKPRPRARPRARATYNPRNSPTYWKQKTKPN